MALGTIASRGTGFLRTFVLLFALGLAHARRRVQQLQHAAEHRVLPHARRHLHRGRGPAAGPGGQGGPGPGRGVRGADLHPRRGLACSSSPWSPPCSPGRSSTCTAATSRTPSEHHAHGGVRLLLHPADLLLRHGLAARRDPERERPVRRQHVDAGHQQRRGDPRRRAVLPRGRAQTSTDTVSSFGAPPARHRHHARHRDPVDLPVPGDVAGRVQHAAALRLAARGDRRDRPDVRLDVRLRGHPVARQPGRAAGGERRRELGRAPDPASSASATPPTPTPGSSSSSRTRSSGSRSSARCCRG